MEDQAEQHQKWWQQLKQHRVAIEVVAIVFVVVIVLIIAGYWLDWTGFNGYKKLFWNARRSCCMAKRAR